MLCFYDCADEVEYVNDRIDEIVTPVNVDRLRYFLDISGYNKEKGDLLLDGFMNGFDIGYRGPSDRRDLSNNIPITVGSEEELWEKIMKEVRLKRYLGPFRQPPFENFIQSPIGLIPKGKENQTRLIFHLSFDFGSGDSAQRSLNYYTPKEYCHVKYRDLDYAIRTCLALLTDRSDVNDGNMTGCDSTTIFFGASDVRSAFRLLPIWPSQRRFLLMKARDPRTGQLAYFSDNCLPFGSSISCSRFQAFSNCLKHIVEYVTQRRFTVTNYLNDFLFVATSRQVCNHILQQFLDICQDIGVPVATEKTEWASPMVIFLGILLNGEEKSLSVPEQKVN